MKRHSDTLFQVMCYWNGMLDLRNFLTFKTFWPSKPSDLHVDALSQHALSYTMLLLTPDINLIIITQTTALYLLYILYAYYVYYYQLYLKGRLTINSKKHANTDSVQAGKKCMNRVSEWKYEGLTFWYIVPGMLLEATIIHKLYSHFPT